MEMYIISIGYVFIVPILTILIFSRLSKYEQKVKKDVDYFYERIATLSNLIDKVERKKENELSEQVSTPNYLLENIDPDQKIVKALVNIKSTDPELLIHLIDTIFICESRRNLGDNGLSGLDDDDSY